MYSIAINNETIDTYDNLNIVLNQTIFSISDFSARGIPYSNNIILPRTKKNVEIFSLNDASVFEYTFSAIIYYKNAATIEGVCNVKSIDEIKNQFKIQIVSDAKTFFDAIKKPMHQLDLLNYDFEFGRTAYTSLRNPATSTVWLWSAIEQRNLTIGTSGNYFTADPYTNLAYLRPCFRVKEILEEIIEQAGYIADTSEIDGTFLDYLIFASNSKNFLFTDFQFLFEDEAFTADTDIDFDNATEEISPTTFQTQLTTDVTVTRIPCKFSIKGTFESAAGISMIIRNTHYEDGVATNIYKQYRIYNDEIDIITDTFNVGDILSIYFDANITATELRVTGLDDETDFYFADGVSFPGSKVVDGWYLNQSGTLTYLLDGFWIKTSYNLPEIDQFDFFKEIWKICNLAITVSENTVILGYNSDFDKRLALNIENISQLRERLPNIELSEINLFGYTNGDDDVILNYGEFTKIFEVENSLSQSNDVIRMNSSASMDVIVNNAETVLSKFKAAYMPVYGETAPYNTIEDDRAILAERFFLYTTDNISGALATEINNVAYFANNSLTDVANDYELRFNSLYENFYEFIYDKLEKNILYKYFIKLTYKQFMQIADIKCFHDMRNGRYLLVLELSKFNPNGLTELKAIEI